MWLGIDFGTCSSSAAIVRRGIGIPVRIDFNATAMPSSAYVERDGKLLIGQEAEDAGLDDPGNLQRQFKRDFGSELPYVLRQTRVRPEALVAEVMLRLRACAESQLALDLRATPSNLCRAVVTVPATYGQHRRDLMSAAARRAGFEQVELLVEPVAASLYFASKMPEILEEGDTLLVYDFGGGTLDAALLTKRGRGFEPSNLPVGDDRLGSALFDAMIFADVREQAPTALRRQLAGEDGELVQRRTLHWLEIECRRLKERLSSVDEARIHFHQDPRKPYVLTRRAFEAMIAPTIEKTLELCHRLVDSASPQNPVAGILLVGGGCRTPYLQREIARRLELPAFLVDDPALAVSLGAALHGHEHGTAHGRGTLGSGFIEVADDVFGAFRDEL